MKKILIEGMTGNLGGVETFVHSLFEVLKEECVMDFIVVDDPIPFKDEYVENGGKIFKITPRYKSVKQFKTDIDKVFEEGNYDVFWFNKTSLSSIDSIKSAKKHKVKNIICHSHCSSNMGSVFTLIMHKFNKSIVNKYITHKAACSAVAAEYFFGKDISDVKIFPNAVNISKYEPADEKTYEVKKKLGLEDKFVIGHAGRFSREKNHRLLIDIFEKYVQQDDACLILCGQGELTDEIKDLVKSKGLEEKVKFLGMRKDMPDVFQAMDVIVMPSLFEGLPFVLVEAQASGIPCIVSDTVSQEAKLTDIIEYVPLDGELTLWTDKIKKYRDYKKISKRDQLTQKGFSSETFAKEVHDIICN